MNYMSSFKAKRLTYPLGAGDPRRSRLGGGDRLGLLPRRTGGEILLNRGEDLLLPRGGGLYNRTISTRYELIHESYGRLTRRYTPIKKEEITPSVSSVSKATYLRAP